MSSDLTTLMAKATSDPDLLESLRAATSAEDLIRIANDHGVPLADADPGDGTELTDAELELAAGGTILHPTMSVFCGTNGNFCTFNPFACASGG